MAKKPSLPKTSQTHYSVVIRLYSFGITQKKQNVSCQVTLRMTGPVKGRDEAEVKRKERNVCSSYDTVSIGKSFAVKSLCLPFNATKLKQGLENG